jgi:hypothetical protein
MVFAICAVAASFGPCLMFALDHLVGCRRLTALLSAPDADRETIEQAEKFCGRLTVATTVFAIICFGCCMISAGIVSQWFSVIGLAVLLVTGALWFAPIPRLERAQADRARRVWDAGPPQKPSE